MAVGMSACFEHSKFWTTSRHYHCLFIDASVHHIPHLSHFPRLRKLAVIRSTSSSFPRRPTSVSSDQPSSAVTPHCKSPMISSEIRLRDIANTFLALRWLPSPTVTALRNPILLSTVPDFQLLYPIRRRSRRDGIRKWRDKEPSPKQGHPFRPRL
jgi:hypothetical protein